MKQITPLAVTVLVVCAVLVAQIPDPQKKTLPPQSPTYPTPAAQKWDPAIEKVIQDYAAAFNRGDGKAAGALYTPDAVLVTPGGELCVGRAEIEKEIAKALSGPFKGAKAMLRIGRVQMVKPDVAVVEGTVEVTGVSTPMTGRYLSTIIRQGDDWRIAGIAAVPAPSAGMK